jgi:U3 small nucleolar RNA-associated protein 15
VKFSGIKVNLKLRIVTHDKLLKKFHHQEAVVLALRAKNPENVVAVVEELVSRKNLLKCVANLDVEELGVLLFFLQRYSTMPRYANMLIKLAQKVVESRIDDINGSEELKFHIQNLKRSINEEIRIQQSLQNYKV